MDVNELNASRLRLQLTEVIPTLEVTAGEKACPPAGRDGKKGGDEGRLWHSKHFVWYRLPPLQRLKPASLADGVFGPTMDPAMEHGVPEDALLLEAFHDGASGKLFLEATPAAGSEEPCMMQMEVLGYMRELARSVTLPSSMAVVGCSEAALAVQVCCNACRRLIDSSCNTSWCLIDLQIRAMKARAKVMLQSDVDDARYDYEQQQLNHILGERMCSQAWSNLVWLWEWGLALNQVRNAIID